MIENEEYLKKILNIERENSRKRKDIMKWSTLKEDISYFFEGFFATPDLNNLPFEKKVAQACIDTYLEMLDEKDDRDQWWEKVRAVSEKNGFATNMKQYKEHPDNFNGSIADFMTIVRFAITGLKDTPDVYEIMKAMGLDKVKKRLRT
jgi:glutamyl-tRNA synthetase